MKQIHAKRAFALITAIVFVVLMAFITVQIMQVSSARMKPASTEYVRAAAKNLVQASAHLALEGWLRSAKGSVEAHGSDVFADPEAIKGSSEVIYLNLDGKEGSQDSYELKIIMTRLSIKGEPGLALLNQDRATADYQICATTEGGSLEQLAPASYCENYTFSN